MPGDNHSGSSHGLYILSQNTPGLAKFLLLRRLMQRHKHIYLDSGRLNKERVLFSSYHLILLCWFGDGSSALHSRY